ncbi:MAG: flagellar hook capping FlgD N-terminal domain-containing protein [Rubrivivax sp.]
MSTSPIDALNARSSGATPATAGSSSADADRFLKLLVAQMQNQDPLNPMDNAQVTTQIAQINTVSGIERLNTTVQGLNAQFVQMQALQGASLVGHDVTVAGNRFAVDGSRAEAGFELDGPADQVTVEVLNAAGHVIDSLNLGALGSGTQGFEWDASGAADPALCSFRVSAKLGAASVGATPLMLDRVTSVASSGGGGLTLALEHSGRVAYGDVRAFN